jgi:histidine decarboxylase
MPDLTPLDLSTGTKDQVPQEICGWLDALRDDSWYDIGYPRATDLPYPDLAATLAHLTLINVGDPWDTGDIRHHTKHIERRVVNLLADLVGAPPSRWGFITSGSSAAIEHAITSARYTFDDLAAYASAAAHGCVSEICARYRIPLIVIRAAPRGAMDTLDLMRQLDRRRDRSAIIIATLGTTWGEALDDLDAINRIADELALDRLHVHADAALSGIPLALLPEAERPACTFAQVPALTSWSTSGHKFLGVRDPSAVIVYKDRPHRPAYRLPYTGAINPTVGCSRSGHLPVIWWHQLTRISLEEHHQRAVRSRQLAAYVRERLDEADWPCWRQPLGFSVVLRRPPEPVLKRWGLSHQFDWSQIKVMPGISREQLDAAIDDLVVARTSATVGSLPAS